jgi:cytochrome b561
MLAVPLSGWLMRSAKGFQTVWFGILPLPDLLPSDKELRDALALVHQGLNLFLTFMVGGDLLAALKHHYLDRDEVLRQILPRRRQPQRSRIQELS